MIQDSFRLAKTTPITPPVCRVPPYVPIFSEIILFLEPIGLLPGLIPSISLRGEWLSCPLSCLNILALTVILHAEYEKGGEVVTVSGRTCNEYPFLRAQIFS